MTDKLELTRQKTFYTLSTNMHSYELREFTVRFGEKEVNSLTFYAIIQDDRKLFPWKQVPTPTLEGFAVEVQERFPS